VYDDGSLPPDVATEMQMALKEAKRKMQNDQADRVHEARQRMVRSPADERLLWGDNLSLEEDDPAVHATFQALTRADRPGLSVVCLHRDGDRLTLEPDGQGPVLDLGVPFRTETIRQLLERTVVVRHAEVKAHFLAEPASPVVKSILDRWRTVPALRYHRVAIFDHGICRLEGTPYTLCLSRKLGLEI
jgi:hypothetical protein